MDVLVPKFDFQMIHLVLPPRTDKGVRLQGFALDAHPYEVSYRLKDKDNGLVEFQYDLYRRTEAGARYN